MAEDEKIIRLKMKLVVILSELQWYMPDDEFYKTFHDTINYLGGYW